MKFHEPPDLASVQWLDVWVSLAETFLTVPMEPTLHDNIEFFYQLIVFRVILMSVHPCGHFDRDQATLRMFDLRFRVLQVLG